MTRNVWMGPCLLWTHCSVECVLDCTDYLTSMCPHSDREVMMIPQVSGYQYQFNSVSKHPQNISQSSSPSISSVQPLSCVQLCVTPWTWTVARQASISITNSQSLLRSMSIDSVMLSNHPVLCCPFPFSLQSFPALGFSSQGVSSSHHMAKVLSGCRFQWY